MNRIAVAALASRTDWHLWSNRNFTRGQRAPGSLTRLGPDGQPAGLCPLKHTDVKAEITGFLARVNVTQEFGNSSQEKIEAVYTFPLPQNAAVDDMTLIVGDRVVRGKIKRREEARAIYDAARAAGQVAGSARSGAAQHLHAACRQHHAGRDRQDLDQLRRDAEIRSRLLRVRVSDGGGAALHSGQTDRKAGRRMGARHDARAGRLPHHAAGGQAGHAGGTRHLGRGEPGRRPSRERTHLPVARRGRTARGAEPGDGSPQGRRRDSQQGFHPELRRGGRADRRRRADPPDCRRRLLHADSSTPGPHFHTGCRAQGVGLRTGHFGIDVGRSD